MKYLNPLRYIRRLKYEVLKLILSLGIPLKIDTKVDGVNIRFVVTSFLEYALRVKQSYTRERVTMNWIRTYIKPNDVIFDIGANVGAYSLLIGKIILNGDGQVYQI